MLLRLEEGIFFLLVKLLEIKDLNHDAKIF